MAKAYPITREQLDTAEAMLKTGNYTIADVKRAVKSSSTKIDHIAHALGICRVVRSRAEVAAEKEKVIALLKQNKGPSQVSKETGVPRNRVTHYRKQAKIKIHRVTYGQGQLEKTVKQLNASMSIRETAKALGVAPTTLYTAEQRAGVMRDSKKAAAVNNARRQLVKETMHLTVTEAAKQIGCSRTNVYYYREKLQ